MWQAKVRRVGRDKLEGSDVGGSAACRPGTSAVPEVRGVEVATALVDARFDY